MRQQSPGHFQLEAAIQAAHMQARLSGIPRWPDIAALYQTLLHLGPTLGAEIGHAIAQAHAQNDAGLGLRLLDALPVERVRAHQPWWAARARLLTLAGRRDDASAAYAHAIALTADPAISTWLRRQAELLWRAEQR